MSGNGVDLGAIYGAINAISAELKSFKDQRVTRLERRDQPAA